MNHLISRSGRWWSGQAPEEGGIYSNDKNNSWTYDEDGRLKDSGTQYSYDAAGHAVSVIGEEGDLTQTQVFDGNGVRTMLSSQQVTHHDSGPDTTETKIQYFVTSSIAGGVVTELDQNGNKERTFVYQGGQILAWQQNGSTETMTWEHRDVSGASVKAGVAAELEPMGMDAGIINPFPLPSTRPSLEAARTYPGFADMAGGQCVVDGIDMPCGMMSGEATAACGEDGCGPKWNPNKNRFEFFVASADGYQGYLPLGATSNGRGGVEGPGTTWLDREATHMDHEDRNPQNPEQTPLSADEVGILRNDVQNLLKKEPCNEFIKAVLEESKRLTKMSRYNTTKGMDLFEIAADVKQGGFYRAVLKNANAECCGGPNKTSIIINSNATHFSNFSDPNPFVSEQRGSTILHELMHLAGYSHEIMAEAAHNVALALKYRNVGQLPDPADFLIGKDGKVVFDGEAADYANSRYFSERVSFACMGKGGYKEALK